MQEAGWVPGSSGQVRKLSALTGNRSPDRPARSQLLYRLSYPAPKHVEIDKYTKNKLWTKLVLFTRLYRDALLAEHKITGLVEAMAFATIGPSVIRDRPVYQINAVSWDGIC